MKCVLAKDRFALRISSVSPTVRDVALFPLAVRIVVVGLIPLTLGNATRKGIVPILAPMETLSTGPLLCPAPLPRKDAVHIPLVVRDVITDGAQLVVPSVTSNSVSIGVIVTNGSSGFGILTDRACYP